MEDTHSIKEDNMKSLYIYRISLLMLVFYTSLRVAEPTGWDKIVLFVTSTLGFLNLHLAYGLFRKKDDL